MTRQSSQSGRHNRPVCKRCGQTFFHYSKTDTRGLCFNCRRNEQTTRKRRERIEDADLDDPTQEGPLNYTQDPPLHELRIKALQQRATELRLPLFEETAKERLLKERLERCGAMGFSPEEVAMLLASTNGQAAIELAAECPTRITHLEHMGGQYVHYKHPITGKVCCYHRDREQPEGWDYTQAQVNLNTAIRIQQEGKDPESQ